MMNNREPILSESAIAARRQFIRDNFKHTMDETMSRTTGPSLDLLPYTVHRSFSLGPNHQDRDHQQLHRPNLDIPMGNTYMTLAQ